jgi:hypothetical protein
VSPLISIQQRRDLLIDETWSDTPVSVAAVTRNVRSAIYSTAVTYQLDGKQYVVIRSGSTLFACAPPRPSDGLDAAHQKGIVH